MRVTQIAAVAAALTMTTMTAQAGTLQDVQARGELNCVVSTGVAGFAAWQRDNAAGVTSGQIPLLFVSEQAI